MDFAKDGSLIAEAQARKLATVLKGRIPLLPRPAVQSGGYVLHTLEASLWCLLTTDSRADAVLKAVNLGLDTDTTGAVAGALAGMRYGVEGMPSARLGQLVKAKEIARLARKAGQACLHVPPPCPAPCRRRAGRRQESRLSGLRMRSPVL